MKKIAFLTLVVLCLLTLPVQAQINLLHEFAGGTSDGGQPNGSLILSGSILYGMTYGGGASDLGTIFKIQTDGTGYTLLHEFVSGIDNDGENPQGSLILSGTTLYGMTCNGGDYSLGTIFKIQTDGSSYARLHEFAGGSADGENPWGSLIISGSTLYGMTKYGGASDYGTIFKIQTDGSGFILLHEFAGGAADGAEPRGDLIISGSTLYGMTYWGGNYDGGTIFNIQTNGIGFSLLHSFAGGVSDGTKPFGSLVLSGSTLYGMTKDGGDDNYGTVFKIETSGTGFSLIHEFAGSTDDGVWPYGSLIISGSTLYGMTLYGGDNHGTIFKIQSDGNGFALPHKFAGGAADGAIPFGSLLLSGSTLYGMTYGGGDSDKGVIFSLPVPSKVDFIGTWDGQGVFYRNTLTGLWVKLATPATLITAGDLDGDAIDDLIGIWPEQGGVWARYSKTGAWAKLSSTARDISTGDMNGDGRDDLVATWDGQGVYYRHSITGAWVQMATPAEQVTAGDLDGDNKDDLIGIWPSQGGVWVKYSQSGSWAMLSTTAIDIVCGDMNGDGRDDLVATWDGQGVYYRNSIGGAWVKLATPATLVTAGDLDGDNKADVIGIWPGQGGVWVKYSQSGSWAQLSSTARHIAAGLMRGGAGSSTTLLTEPLGGVAEGPESVDFGSVASSDDGRLQCLEEKNLDPQQDTESELQRMPGPGEYGFQCLEQKNLVPGSVIFMKKKGEEKSRQQ